jgi:hypothetical protein
MIEMQAGHVLDHIKDIQTIIQEHSNENRHP